MLIKLGLYDLPPWFVAFKRMDKLSSESPLVFSKVCQSEVPRTGFQKCFFLTYR